MARDGIIGIGIFFLIIAIIGYNVPLPITLADTTTNLTIPKVVAFCDSGLGQLGQMLAQVAMVCSEYNNFMMGIYGSVLLGIILIIVGSVTGKKKKSAVCSYCNFVAKSENELLEHKSKNHLDKSPYKCEHCDFIGITEEILWNHYNDKHPNEKKW